MLVTIKKLSFFVFKTFLKVFFIIIHSPVSFCPMTTLTEPSIIPSTYIFSLENTRHKTLYQKPEASTCLTADSLKSIKGTRKKKRTEVMVPENDTCEIQNADFVSYVPGPAAWRAQPGP